MLQHTDAKQRKQATTVLVEEVLCKRPFIRALTLLLLNDSEDNSLRSSGWFDLAKLARECLKGLTSEDLRQIYILSQSSAEAQGALEGYENRYTNITLSGLEGELSKIMLRYKKEGYPHRLPSPAALPEIVEEAQNAFVSQISPRQSLHEVSHVSHREVTLNKEQTPQ